MDERDLDESELEEEAEREEEGEELEGEEFGELIKYTLSGFAGGLVLAAVLDRFGFAGSGVGQWLVRTLAGEGESVLEGLFALRKRLSRSAASMAEAYGWGKLLGIAFPWVIDGGSRLLGVEVNGVPGFYIPFFYALSDQIGGNVSGLMFLKRREGEWGGALRAYFTHPVMMTGLAVIALVPAGLFAGRWLGFIPATQVYTALETIAANLCWLPPLVGYLAERRRG